MRGLADIYGRWRLRVLNLGRLRLYYRPGRNGSNIELSSELRRPMHDDASSSDSGTDIAVAEPRRGIAEPSGSGNCAFTEPGRFAFAESGGGGCCTFAESNRGFAEPSGNSDYPRDVRGLDDLYGRWRLRVLNLGRLRLQLGI